VGNTDLGELAARMCAGLDGVRACLVLSSDGLTLGAYPADGEELGREVWDRFEQVAAPQRGFLDLGEEVWVIARRGPYTAVLVSAVALRPGLLLDRVEALLRAAEETRIREPEAPAKPEMRRPRPHRARQEPELEPEPPTSPRPKRPVENGQPGPRYSPPEELTSAASKVVDVAKLEEQPAAEEEPAPAGPLKEVDPDQIDRVALAREFGRLIAESESAEER
jgi:hypothetical protein